ncbi:HAD-IC family P-type ATPase [Candidatus Gracilibacteria bacterium]|nr:HAD-IC family P-type ATPase [Candidatus Gracilibacteria bacterium]NJM90386.1 HAD-IC family P-type ATPase [Hydrococcus sp. RU_2_2]
MQTHSSHLQGLSDREAANRRAAGQGNDLPIQTSRTYSEILRDNLFTFINGAYFFLSLVLIALGRVSDVTVLAFVICLNVVTNVIQEIRAKKKLDKIALVTRPKASIIREGREREIDPSEIVVGDLLVVRPGDQIVVDGSVIGEGKIKVDESLLTGESDLIPKQAGDLLYSGSFCVSGIACYEAQKVGSESLASQMTSEARKFRKVLTPLQRQINLTIRLLLGVAILLGAIVTLRIILGVIPFTIGVQNIAVIVGLVPSGLYLMITLAYTFGAVRIANQSALVQQSNAVESISHVDTICLDKTGTLTTNRIHLQTVFPIDRERSKLESLLGDYAASVSTSNKTNDAIATAFPKPRRSLQTEVPFGSAHKWSAIAFSDEPGVYLLGAPEILGIAMPLSDDLHALIGEGAAQGLRVLLFAHSSAVTELQDEAGNPLLPTHLTPLGILYFGDELRPDAYQILAEFQQAGIQVKIISGDNPATVAALAKQAGLGDDIIAVSGQELAQMDDATFTQTAGEGTIFGRITPEQKARLVKSLQSRDRYVAMMGDGVNDVLSLKQANVGIAMESGSQATRGVADIVLLNDSFNALPKIFLEGQRIRNGVADINKLFMVRIFSFILTIVAIGMITLTFPFGIKTSTIVTFLTVGIPPFFVTLWAQPNKTEGRDGNSFLHFVLPATLSLSLASILVYLYFLADHLAPILDWLRGDIPLEALDRQISLADISRSRQIAEKGMVTMQIFGGLLLLPFLKPPTRFWVAGEPLCRDWRFTILAGVVFLFYVAIVAVPSIGNFFELYPLKPIYYWIIGAIALIWMLAVRWIWRQALLDRFLGIKISPF